MHLIKGTAIRLVNNRKVQYECRCVTLLLCSLLKLYHIHNIHFLLHIASYRQASSTYTQLRMLTLLNIFISLPSFYICCLTEQTLFRTKNAVLILNLQLLLNTSIHLHFTVDSKHRDLSLYIVLVQDNLEKKRRKKTF